MTAGTLNVGDKFIRENVDRIYVRVNHIIDPGNATNSVLCADVGDGSFLILPKNEPVTILPA